jgi:hypothetical protein
LLKRESLGEIKENMENYEEDYLAYKESMLYNLKNKCAVKITENAPLKDLIKKHPIIQNYDQTIESFNTRIRELQQNLKSDITNYKKRIEYLKQILKDKGLSDLEKNVIRLNIKDERKTYKRIVNLKRKETLKAQKEIKKSINATEKLRKKKFSAVRKTLKKKLSVDKKEKRNIERAEKKLRKTLRKQGDLKEEVNDDILKGLLKKYTGKIYEDLLDVDARIHASDLEKEEKLKKKEADKAEKKKQKDEEREINKKMKEELKLEKKRVRELEKATRKAERDTEKQAKRSAARKTRKTRKAK